jgi:hypothetical protein
MADAKQTSPKNKTLKPASASEDIEVRQLLAERETAVTNGQHDRVAQIGAQLAEMGFDIEK